MKLHWILFLAICLLGFSTPVQGSLSLQDFIDIVVNAGDLNLNSMLSSNNSVVGRIWNYFKTKYNRVYSSSAEEKQRLNLFVEHLKFVLEVNLQKLRTFKLELNEFADWTSEEFDALKKGLNVGADFQRRGFDEDSSDEDPVRRDANELNRDRYLLRRMKRNMINRRHHQYDNTKRGFTSWVENIINSVVNNNDTKPDTSSFDWRSKNVVSSVKNQGRCGSCYAFATAAVIESVYAIKTKSITVTEFSPQQLVDCSSNGNNACNGGNFGPSIRYISESGGKFATLASYPYAGTKQTCKTSGINQINLGKIQNVKIPLGDEKAMAEALVKYGPLFIALDTESQLFKFYKSGVLTVKNCPTRSQDMDHAMAVVGYGYDNALKTSYWIIRNSWGTGWGENGYLRLAKDKGNMCGITSMAGYTTLV